ncbi:MAG: response regulator [Acidobacteria bacterium]|nr:response regulator [Acidobacteriota bacterium]MBI3471019.1 response regulator [Candidatus Solibacter usitatus]
MRAPESSRVCTVLLAAPADEDHRALRQIFEHSNWKLWGARTYTEAAGILKEQRIGVIICDQRLPDAGWREFLSFLQRSSDPPSLIVSSALADERLWSEVLNLGGFDVLPTPFDPREVFRIVSLAWRWWCGQGPRPLALAAG